MQRAGVSHTDLASRLRRPAPSPTSASNPSISPPRLAGRAARPRALPPQRLQPPPAPAGVLREKLGAGHDALRTTAIGKRNGPIPDIAMLRMHGDEDLLPVKVRTDRYVVLHMGED